MRTYGTGTAGGDGPDREQLERSRRRFSRPENEVPRVLPVSAVLGRTDDAVVALVGVAAYTTGLSLDAVVRLRVRPPGMRGGALHELTGGWGAYGAERATGLLLGLEYADGRTASTLGGPRQWPPGELGDDEPTILQQGGGGSELSVDESWWLSPLPPDGPLRIVVRCDVLGLDETVTELDGTAIRAAAAGVVTLWPWVSPQAVQPPEPPALDLPAGSWFARG